MRDPFSLEAEQAVLGAMMKAPEMIDLLATDISAKDFYWQDNADVFKAIMELNSLNRNIDFLTVGEHIGSLGNGEGGPAFAYCAEIQNGTPSTANAEQYARIVRERSMDRALIAMAQDIHEIAHSTMQSEDKISQTQTKVLSLDVEAATNDTVNMFDALVRHMDVMDERFNGGDEIKGIATGHEEFDKHTGGLQNGGLYLVAGRPKMGKSTLAIGWCQHAATKGKKKVMMYHLEMTEKQVMDKILAAEATVALDKLKSGAAMDESSAQIMAAISKLKDAHLDASYRSGYTMQQIRADARRKKRKDGLDLVMVDHLGLLNADDPKSNQVMKITEISRQAKLMAKELNIPVILLSQLNRQLEQRPDKRPVPSDLRDSGALEQDADMIIFAYRDEIYHKDTDRKGIAEIIIGAARDVSSETFFANFQGKYSRFVKLDPATMQGWDDDDFDPPSKGDKPLRPTY
ncbi:MAG: DnaB-like DNA helicase [Bacteriophage sp.]|nr:MAG: DnaB-like DNA helicase [Bacteriophage sp.]